MATNPRGRSRNRAFGSGSRRPDRGSNRLPSFGSRASSLNLSWNSITYCDVGRCPRLSRNAPSRIPVSKIQPTVIDERSDGDRPYLLVDDHEDRISRTGKQLIAAANLHITFEVWKSNFELMLQDVRKWCEERSAKVSRCFADVRSQGIEIFFVPNEDRFDFDLADQMAQLDRDLVNTGVGWVETLQIPSEEVDRFVEVERAILVYPEANVVPSPSIGATSEPEAS